MGIKNSRHQIGATLRIRGTEPLGSCPKAIYLLRLYRNFDVNIIAIAAEHLQTASRTTLNVATPMVVVAILGTAVGATLTRRSQTLITIFHSRVLFAVAENMVD